MTAAFSCPSCDNLLGATAKFCRECGTLVAQAVHSAEHKQMTVLFAVATCAPEPAC